MDFLGGTKLIFVFFPTFREGNTRKLDIGNLLSREIIFLDSQKTARLLVKIKKTDERMLQSLLIDVLANKTCNFI